MFTLELVVSLPDILHPLPFRSIFLLLLAHQELLQGRVTGWLIRYIPDMRFLPNNLLRGGILLRDIIIIYYNMLALTFLYDWILLFKLLD